MSRRGRGRIVVGTYVKVNVSDWTDLIVDMGLLGPDKQPLKRVWMYGFVKSIKPNHFEVDILAAEETYDCVKDKCEFVLDVNCCPPMFVVMDDKKTIKKVQGLQLELGFTPTDYFQSVEEAQARYPQAVLSQPQQPVVPSAALTTSVESVAQVMLFVIYTV